MSDPLPLLPPEEAIKFFRAKGLAASFAWQDVWQAEHARAFTVAKAMSRSVLEAIREALDSALAEGTTLEEFRRTLRPRLEELGWWGKKRMTDPLTGESKSVQLGSPRRLKIIFNTNMRTAYAVGRYERIQRVKSALPIMVYKTKDDGKVRPQHEAWHNVALPVDHPWWDTHYPPCDWECRCQTVSMTRGQAARRGLISDKDAPLDALEPPPANPSRRYTNPRTGEVIDVEGGIGPGWGYHVGRSPLDGQMPRPLKGFGLDESEAIAAARPKIVDAFLARFGLSADGQYIDAAGWPLAIGEAWLRGLSFADQDRAIVAAETISRPDAIRLVWVRGKDGRMMLFRRYLRAAPELMSSPAIDVADVGAAGWRFKRFMRSAAGSILSAGSVTYERAAPAR